MRLSVFVLFVESSTKDMLLESSKVKWNYSRRLGVSRLGNGYYSARIHSGSYSI